MAYTWKWMIAKVLYHLVIPALINYFIIYFLSVSYVPTTMLGSWGARHKKLVVFFFFIELWIYHFILIWSGYSWHHFLTYFPLFMVYTSSSILEMITTFMVLIFCRNCYWCHLKTLLKFLPAFWYSLQSFIAFVFHYLD